MKNKALNLLYKLLIILSIFAILPACSISDDDDDASNSAPSVSAGEDQTVNQGATVDLVGVASDSDGSISSWLWKQTSGSHSVTIKNSTTSNAYFSAPTVDTETTLVFELEVKDNDGASVSDSMRVTVLGPGDSVNPLPDNFEAEAGDGQVTLTWTHHSGATYNIYRSSDPNCELANYTTCTYGALFTSKSSGFTDDTGLTNGTNYYYWIEAILNGVTYLDGDFISATPRVDDDIDLTDGLVAHYEFENNADDSSGNENHGEVVGATLTSDRFGEEDGAYHIAADSSFDRISLPRETVNGLEDFTIAAWVKFDAENINHTTILSVANSRYDNELYIGYYSVNGEWSIIASDSGVGFSDATELPLNQWLHFALTRHGSSSSIYLDGILIDTVTVVDYALEADTGGVIIGQDQDSLGGRFDSTQSLNGDIDSFRIYDRSLSVAEVQALYELGNDTDVTNGLVAHYKFESDADDSSGNAYHGEVIGATPTSGRFGEEDGAYHIAADSSFDRISLPAETIDGLVDFTVASWLRFDAENINHTTILSVANSRYDNELYIGYYSVNGEWSIIASDSGVGFSNATELPLNKWLHFALTRHGSSSSIYLDGVLIDTITVVDYALEADTSGVIIGQDQDSLGGRFDSTQSLNGDIDSFRIYNRALTTEEIQTLYELGDD